MPKLSNVDVKIVLREMYEEFYNIHTHSSKTEGYNPLASVAMHPCENITDHSLLEEAMEDYIKYKILEHFGLSWTEYITQPREIVEMQRRIAEKTMASLDNKATNAEKKIGRELMNIRKNKSLR